MMQRLVTTTYLEMTSRDMLRPARPSALTFQLVRVDIPCPELNRCLYTAVGARWWWYSRLSWDYPRWLAYLDRPDLETWVAYVSGTPAGYFELERQPDAAVELAYFGLLPRFIGKGIGGALLTAAITRAWEMGAQRVWVHTCSLDHPQALANYQARGFRIVRVEEQREELPDEPLQPWPGANLFIDDREASHPLQRTHQQLRAAEPVRLWPHAIARDASMSSWFNSKTEKRASPIHGRGLFARVAITAGEIVAVKGGAIMDAATLSLVRDAVSPAELQIELDLYIAPHSAEEVEANLLCLNHSCHPNVGVQGQITFVAMRNIPADAELTIDYAMIDGDPAERMACACGAAECRQLITGDDWRLRALQQRYAGYFSRYLQDRFVADDA